MAKSSNGTGCSFFDFCASFKTSGSSGSSLFGSSSYGSTQTYDSPSKTKTYTWTPDDCEEEEDWERGD